MTTMDWSMTGGLPPELESERQRLRREQAIADALIGQRPYQPPAGAVYSPFGGLADMVNAYSARKRRESVDKGFAELGNKYQTGLAEAVQKYSRAKTGVPGSTETIVDEQANGGEGATAQITAPAVAGDPRKAILDAMVSPYAPVQRVAQMDLQQLNRTEDRADTQAFRAAESQAAREARMQELQMRLADQRTAAADRMAMQRELAQMQIAARQDLAKLAASLRPAPQQPAVTPVTVVENGKTVVKDARTGNVIGVSPADTKIQGAFNADTASLQNSESALNRLEQAANEVLNHKGLERTTGLMGMLPNIPGSAASDAEAKLEQLKSQAGFAVLQAMRDASKTGGALGNVSNFEVQALQNNLAALQKAQSPEQIKAELQKLIDFSTGAKARLRNAFNVKHGDKKPTGGGSGTWEVVN